MMKAWGRQRPRVGRFVLAMMLAALIPGWAHAQSVLPQDANGAWQSLTRHNPLGSPRAIYDPLRQRLVVFGTNQPYYPNEVWSFSLAGLPGWIRLVPTTSGSNHLEGESAIYDAAGDRMILFGGYERNNGPPIGWGLRNYTVALLLPGTGEWSFFAIGGTPPAARYHHSAIYDPVRNRMIVFGGSSTGGLANDVWELSLGHGPPKWTQLTPSGAPPSPRAEHSAIYDPVRDRMVVFGGNDGTTRQNDVWALSLAGTPTWSLLTPSGTPPSVRSAHSAIYDADNDRMVVFGGWNGTQYFSDTWTLTLAGATGWAELAPAGTLPGARAYHATVVDPAQHRIIVFGGRSDVAGYSDTWAMSLTGTPTWTALWGNSGPQGPLFRSDHSAIYDPVGDRMLMFGGSVSSGQGNDVWTLPLTNLPKWAPLSPTGTAPSGRFSHSAVYDPVRQRMLILFGLANGSFTNEVWALSLDGPMTWAPLTPTGTPPQGRLSQATIYDPVRDRILVFGGWNGSVHLGDLWSLSLSTDTWTQLTPTGTPPAARTKHTAIYDPVRDRMLLFGGSNAVFLNDVWSLDLAGAPNWTLLGPTGTPPSARDGHVAIYDAHRDRMVTFGGGNDGPLNDVWAMSLTGPPAWSPLVPAGILPLGRERPATIYDPLRDRMVTFAGRWLSTLYDDTWALNWSALHTIAATAGANGIVTPSGAVYVAEATDRTFTISPNSGYQIEDVIVDGVSVGVTGSYTFTNVLAGHSITATFVANAGVGPGAFSSEFSLSSPSPNPCTRGSFNMELGLTRPAHVRLVVYDAAGREVARLADRFFEAGRHALRCTAGTLDTGLYWVHGRADGREVTRRLAVMR